MGDGDSLSLNVQKSPGGSSWLTELILAGIRLARERQVNVRVVSTGKAIEESVDLAYEISTGCFGGCLKS